MKKRTGRWISLLMSMLITIMIIPANTITAQAASKPKLSKKTVSLVIGGTSTIKVKNAPKGVKIKYKSSKSKVVSVSPKGKIKGLKSGTSKITVSIKKKGSVIVK